VAVKTRRETMCVFLLYYRSYSEAAEECTQLTRSSDCSVGDVLRRTYDEVGPALPPRYLLPGAVRKSRSRV
jgi:hypothetical protein